jgi:membrane protein YdbS with pleckstrin-like domain
MFFAVSFFAFFINYTLVDNIYRISFLEVIASLGIGLGFAVLYGIIKNEFFNEKSIIIENKEIKIVAGNKTDIYKFKEIKALDIISTALLKMVGIISIKIETEECCVKIYLQNKDKKEFLNQMPRKILPVNKKNEKGFGKDIKLNLLVNLLRTTEFFLIGSLCIMPATLVMVAKSSVDMVWKCAAVVYLSLLAVQLILFLVKNIKYYDYEYFIDEDKISITCGRIVNKTFYLSIENITAVYFSHNFISRLFNLYRINLLTRGSGKGIIETNYFPFMINKTDAQQLMLKLVPEKAVNSPINKPDKKTVLPSLVIWLLPVFLVIVVSILGTPWFLLLLNPIALFLIITFKNNGKIIEAGYYVMQKGFLSTTRIFIPLIKIERIDSLMTVTCRILDMAYIEIYLSGYRAVVFGSYYYKSEFDNFVKNINELS